MKYFESILFLALLIGCSQENRNRTQEKQNSNDMDYGTQLFESGFLKFADTLKLDSLKSELISSFDIYNEDNNKIAHVDAEELAEFSFDFFLPNLNNMLEKRGFKLNVKTANDYENTNDIFINTEKVKLYTKDELQHGTFWESASRNFFKEVNKQLGRARIEESFYLLYGGNDLHVLLLTKDQHEIIAENYKNQTKEIPYIP